MGDEFSDAAPSIHLHDIDIDVDFLSSELVSESVHADSVRRCSPAPNLPDIPPPTKFSRKATKSCGTSPLLSMPTRTPPSPDATLDRAYKLHRQYVRSLIMEESSAAQANPSPHPYEWEDCESCF